MSAAPESTVTPFDNLNLRLPIFFAGFGQHVAVGARLRIRRQFGVVAARKGTLTGAQRRERVGVVLGTKRAVGRRARVVPHPLTSVSRGVFVGGSHVQPPVAHQFCGDVLKIAIREGLEGHGAQIERTLGAVPKLKGDLRLGTAGAIHRVFLPGTPGHSRKTFEKLCRVRWGKGWRARC